MPRGDSFLLTPGRLPWRLVQPTRRSRSGVVYDADGRLVCVAALGNAREIVRMAKWKARGVNKYVGVRGK